MREDDLNSYNSARVIAEHRDAYTVVYNSKVLQAEITGKLRFDALTREDLPVVGDRVGISEYDDEHAIIHGIHPRNTILARKAVEKKADLQIIAANIDVAYIVQSVDRNFNLNRMDRCIAIANAGKIQPVIVLNKTDLITPEELQEMIKEIKTRNRKIKIVTSSNIAEDGIKELKADIDREKTYCFIGSSGVGKSTLINNLLGDDIIKTDSISSSTNKGKHTTTRRELFVLENGGYLIDTPGMREIGIVDSDIGLADTFGGVYEIIEKCRFINCSHTNEPGCALIEALESGEIDRGMYNSFMKLKKESEFFEMSALEKRQKDKDFGKMVKEVMKHKKKNKL